jgi:hypothetical protein
MLTNLTFQKNLVFLTFNVEDLKHYVGEEEQIPSRTTSLQEGKDDEDMTPADSTTTPTSSTTPAMTQGPMTQSLRR